MPGADPARIANQLLTEYQSGQKASVDIFLGSAAQMAPLSQRDFFIPIDWHQYLPDRIGPDLMETDNKIVRIGTTLSGVTYNEQLAPMTPTALTDFLKPEWKGRIASTPYAAGFDVLLSDDMWGVDKTLNYVTALSKQIAGLIRCGENERASQWRISLPSSWIARDRRQRSGKPKARRCNTSCRLTVPRCVITISRSRRMCSIPTRRSSTRCSC